MFRRTHHLLKKILPDNLEYVVILRKTPIQKNLYKEFVKFIQKELTGEDAAYYNPLKAHAVCSKVTTLYVPSTTLILDLEPSRSPVQSMGTST
jgi:hypothetical protein